MSSGSLFQDWEIEPGQPDGEYWRAILDHLLRGQSVEVIDDGGQQIVLRVWFGERKNGSNVFDLDPGQGPF